MTLRDDILKKYGVGTGGSSSSGGGGSSPTTTASTSSQLSKQAILNKYVNVKPATTPVSPPPTSSFQEIPGYKGEVISAAPKKNIFQKIGSSISNFFTGDNVTKDAVVQAVSSSIADKSYAEIGRQMGLDKTIRVVLPSGVDPQKVDPITYSYYKDKAIAENVKNNYSKYGETYNLPDPKELTVDPNVVSENLSDFTKALGIRSTPTFQEVAGTLFTLPIAGALISNPITTVLGIAAWEGVTALEKQMLGGKELYEIIGQNASEPVKDALFLGELVLKGKALHSIYKAAPSVAEKFIRDVQVKYNLPKNIYIEPVKIKSIFQTGEKISPEETELVKSLGLTGEQYKSAIRDGVSIEVPAERITTMVDKPWWGKLKGIINLAPTNEVIKVETEGKISQGPRGLLDAPSEETIATLKPQPAPPKVKAILESPISSKNLDLISRFTPTETAAFGKKIIEKINEAVGTNLNDVNTGELPNNMTLNQFKSSDGRPAQFNNQGKIEVFLPNLIEDLGKLSKGGEIIAHGDNPKYSKVYKLQNGETIEELAVRYVKDVLIHEKAHQKTMTAEDQGKISEFRGNIITARASGNVKSLTAAETAMDNFMKGLEEKALQYEKENRSQLEFDTFGKKGNSTEFQRTIDQALKGGPEKKVTISEKKLVRESFRIQAKGARAGLIEGKKIGDQRVEETKVKYTEAIEGMKNKELSVKEKQNILIGYAQSFLPASIRGKFLKAVNNTRSEKDFLDVLGRMQKASDSSTRAALIGEIRTELKGTVIKSKDGLPNVKFEHEAQRKLNRIRANIKGDYLTAQMNMSNIISEFQLAHPDDVLPDNIIGEVQMLKMVGIQDMTAKELRSVLQDIQSIKETGRTLREIERFNRETETERAREKIREILSGGKPSPSELQSLRQNEKPSRIKTARNFFTIQQFGLEEMLDDLSRFDKSSKQYESFLSRYVTDRTNVAFNKQNAGEGEQIDIVNKSFKEIYKMEKNSDVLSEINEMKKIVNLGKIVHADGVERTLNISRGQAIQMHMWMKDETLQDTFRDTLNWGEAVLDTVDNFLTSKDKAFADKLLEFYRGYYETINPVFIKEFGIDLPFNENYSPVTRDVDTFVPENVLLSQETSQYATARNNSLKGRVRNKIELKTMDALENVTRHIAKMEHYKAWSEAMQDLRKVFGNKQIRKDIIDFHGKERLKIMDNFLNDFARDGVSREKIIRFVDQFRANATKALLGLNWRVGFKQLVGVLNYGIELPFKDFVTGVASFWSSPIEKSRFLYKNSGVLQERFGQGFDRDIKFAIQNDYDRTFAKKKQFSEWFFSIIRTADKLTVYHGSWASYRSGFMEAKRNGASDAEAKAAGIRMVDNVTNRIQESSRLDTLSELQRGGSLMKLLTMFASQPSKYLRIIVNSGRNYRAGRGDKVTHVKRMLWAWFVVPIIYNAVANLFINEKYRASPKGLLIQTALGPLSYPLIAGQVFQSIYGWTTGERFAYNPSAVTSFMDDLQKAISGFTTGDAIEATTYLLDSIGKTTGTPTPIFTKPLRKKLKEENDSPVGEVASF